MFSPGQIVINTLDLTDKKKERKKVTNKTKQNKWKQNVAKNKTKCMHFTHFMHFNSKAESITLLLVAECIN